MITTTDLNELERRVLEKLLEGRHETLERLRTQVDHSRVASREFSNVGVFTNLVVDRAQAEPISGHRSLVISDVEGDLAGLAHGAGFVLFVEEGYLEMLEAFSYGEHWPAYVSSLSLRYAGGGARNLAALDLDERP